MGPYVKPHGKESGFTLLEILVGLTISSLIMVGLSMAMGTINRGFDQTTAVIERQDSISAGLHVVAGDIAHILRVLDDQDKPQKFLFYGGPEEAIYILAERPGNNKAGLYWVRLLVRKTAEGTELSRMRAPYVRGEADIAALEWDDEVSLLRGKYAIALSYRAPRAGLRSWAGNWLAQNMMPGQIKVEITDLVTARRRVPVFVTALRISAEADCISAEAAACTLRSGGAIAAKAAPK